MDAMGASFADHGGSVEDSWGEERGYCVDVWQMRVEDEDEGRHEMKAEFVCLCAGMVDQLDQTRIS